MIIEGIEIADQKAEFSIFFRDIKAGKFVTRKAQGYRFCYHGATWYLSNEHSRSRWLIYEERTGMKAGSGPTRAHAIRNLKENTERFKGSQKQLDSAIRRARIIGEGMTAV